MNLPITGADVASVIGWDTTTVDNDTEEDETRASADLDDTQDELSFTVALDTEKLNRNQGEEQRCDPGCIIDAVRALPIVDDIAGGRELKWQDNQPGNSVLPAACETPRRVDESADVHGESAIDRVHDGQFGKSLHHEHDLDTDNDEAEEHRAWSAILKSTT